MLQSLASAFYFYCHEETSKAQQKDICAFALFALKALAASIDQTAKAWENRDYWIKADRLRSDWEWTTSAYNELLTALRTDNISSALNLLENISVHFESVTLPRNKSSRSLWKGAWVKWKNP
ncbi:MAG: hypothetical protein P8Z41_13595 [Anaerolineales bacterium]